MAKLSKKEFAELCGMETNKLAVYVQRKKAIAGDDGLFDTANLTNKAFIAKHSHKSGIQLPKEPIQRQPRRMPVVSEDEDMFAGISDEELAQYAGNGSIMPLEVSERHYKHFLALRTEKASELEQLKIEKAKAEVIPHGVIAPLFLYHNQSVLTKGKEFIDKMLIEWGHRFGINIDEIAKTKTAFYVGLNEWIEEATNLSIKGVDNIVKDYAIKKGIGGGK